MKQAKAAIGHQDKPHCADPNIERPLNKGSNGYDALYRQGIYSRVSHLQFFLISELFHAGMNVCHIQEQ